MLLIGAAVGSISSFIVFLAPSYSILLVAWMIIGIGTIVIIPVGFSMLADYASPWKRGKAFSILPIALALGSGGGIILANAFGETAWRPPFLVISIIGMIIVMLSLLFFHEPERGGSEPELRKLIQEGRTYGHRINIQKIKNTLGIRTNRWLAFSKILWRIPLGIYAYKFIPFLEMYGLSPGSKTIVTLFVGSGAVFGYLLGGVIGDWANKIRTGRILVSVLSLGSGIIFLFLALLIPRPEVLWSFNAFIVLLFALLGVVLVFINIPNVDAIVGDVNVPETRGMFISILNSIGWLGVGTGILLSGIKAEATWVSYKGILLWGTMVWLLTIISWLPLFGTIKKDAGRLREIMAQRAKEIT